MMNHNELETMRSNLYGDYILSIGTPREKALLKELDELDAMLDEMEGIEKPEEETNTATNWAEWELDHMIDSYLEDRMAYEV